MAPDGWSMALKPKLIELAAPEGDFHIALVDIGAAADAKAAVAAAWALWASANARSPKLITARAARNGWDERQVVDCPLVVGSEGGKPILIIRDSQGESSFAADERPCGLLVLGRFWLVILGITAEAPALWRRGFVECR